MASPAKLGQNRPDPGKRLLVDPARSVFINCPFDDEFEQLFDALVFAIVCCGFTPRSALESGSVAEPRMERIAGPLFSSKYSIHDLSRCRGHGEANLARFNMPLELGMAMARRYLAGETGVEHDWLLLVPESHPYMRFLSDLAGFDPKAHNGTVVSLVPKVAAWLVSRPDAVPTPSPRRILAALPSFRSQKSSLAKEWGGNIPWTELVTAARKSAPSL